MSVALDSVSGEAFVPCASPALSWDDEVSSAGIDPVDPRDPLELSFAALPVAGNFSFLIRSSIVSPYLTQKLALETV